MKVKATMTFCLPVRPPQATILNHSEEPWPPHITFYWDKHPHHPQPCPPQKAHPTEEQPSMAALLAPTPKQSPRLKRCHPSPEPMGSTPTAGGPPNPK